MHESEKWNWSRSVVSDSSWSHGLQPARLLHPWDPLGKSTGGGCHCPLRRVQIFVTPWTAAYQAPSSMGLPRQEYWSGLPLPSPIQPYIHMYPFSPRLPPIFIYIFKYVVCTQLQYSCLENPMGGGAWWAAVHGVSKSRTWLSDFTFTSHFHALEKEMATHSSVLAWRIPGTGEPGGLPSMGSHRVGHDWSNLAAAAAAVCWKII